MVSRDKSLCRGFLKLGAEDILRTAIERHVKRIEYDAKAALRDLDCAVDWKKVSLQVENMIKHNFENENNYSHISLNNVFKNVFWI